MGAEHGHRRGVFRVVIAGGGVAGLETLLALHALAGDFVDLELLAPEPQFWYRPLAPAEPFDAGRARRFDLARIAEHVGALFTLGQLASVDTDACIARTTNGTSIEYDTLVVACGAAPRPWLTGALTFRGPADSDKFRALLTESETGSVRSIAFTAPPTGVWPLPLYELALQTAAHLEARGKKVELTLATPEPEPLSLFGHAATTAMRRLLAESKVRLLTSCYAVAYYAGTLALVPRSTVHADRVVALPRLEGSRILGLPQDADGFIRTDLNGRVHGLSRVYAAGDVTAFPLKQGGIAAQQGDAVAESIAAEAGADVEPHRFRPVLRGLLLTGGTPHYLRNEPTARHGDRSTIATETLWWPPAKIVGRYLSPFLATYGGLDVQPPEDASDALAIEVEVT
jgi:sulfide:quinone oxidoreductase